MRSIKEFLRFIDEEADEEFYKEISKEELLTYLKTFEKIGAEGLMGGL